ncbi:MAG TPA: hypothetical protein VL333_01365 [Candidatus Saccharimonadales bacterium]|jgi:hypothetical protein|nr:hypothetical protein [Candidatus Saccharimonadales bacterium]
MRFALAVGTAAALDLAVLLRIDQWIGAAALLAIGYLLFASAGAGFFAGTRSGLAGALAVIAGVLLSGLVQYWPRFAYANDLGVLVGFELQLLIAFVPYAIGGAIAGYLGGVARTRILRPGRASPAPAEPRSKG